MIPVYNTIIIPLECNVTVTMKTKRVQPISQNLLSGEVLWWQECIGGVVEWRPDWEGTIGKDKVAIVVEGSGGDAKVGGGGVPDGVASAIE